jgi:hypothetical protein
MLQTNVNIKKKKKNYKRLERRVHLIKILLYESFFLMCFLQFLRKRRTFSEQHLPMKILLRINIQVPRLY